MNDSKMRTYERQMSSAGYSVFYQGRTRTFDNNAGSREVWERVNAKWVKISSR